MPRCSAPCRPSPRRAAPPASPRSASPDPSGGSGKDRHSRCRSRRRLLSISARIALRDRPAPFGPFVHADRAPWWRGRSRRDGRTRAGPRRRSPRSIRRSTTFAVSRKLMPASSACRMNGRLASSSSVHGWMPRPGSPKLMQPRQMRETSRPVRPRVTYSTCTSESPMCRSAVVTNDLVTVRHAAA